MARLLARAAERRRPKAAVPSDEKADAEGIERVEKIKATAVEMMELSRGRCRQLTEEGKFDEALSESEEAGYWWDRATGRGA